MGLLSIFNKSKEKFDLIKEGMDKTETLFLNVSKRIECNLPTIISAIGTYDGIFKKLKKPNVELTPNIINYDDIKRELPRESVKYKSHGYTLQGYYFSQSKPKGLVIVVHGLHSGVDDYLSVIKFFYDNKYNVFAFNSRGVYESEGNSVVGFSQQLVDLDGTLNYLKKSSKYNKLPLCLFGHSCGGNAVTTILNLHSNIKAVAAVAPVNNCFNLFIDKGYQYAGAFGDIKLINVFQEEYQKILFKDYYGLDGVSGINKTKIPILIAHGKNDKVISFKGQSIISHKDEITNPHCNYYVTDGLLGGHTSILYSEEANSYRDLVDSGYKELCKNNKKLSNEDKINYYKKVDRILYNEINYDLFTLILKTFNSVN